jgi:hypothetical protein
LEESGLLGALPALTGIAGIVVLRLTTRRVRCSRDSSGSMKSPSK